VLLDLRHRLVVLGQYGLMDVVELADLLARPPEQGWHEGLDGVAAVWHFWEYVSLRVHLTGRGAVAPEYTTTVHGDSFDIDVPGMPGWRRGTCQGV
jgi:hypothetical protein